MIRAILLLAALLLSPGGDAQEPYAPTREQLQEMLSGNSMEGIWAGRPYLQYFATDGSTLYRERGGIENEGLWRVDEAGQLCAQWPPAETWVCHSVLVIGTNLYWQAGDEYFPAEIRPGNAL